MPDQLDVIIIGAGSAGLSALREVRKRTERFVLINDGPYGTTCARVGCMPSKALIEAAKAFHARHHHAASRLGIEVSAFHSKDALAGLSDTKVNAVLRAALEQEFAIHTGARVELAEADTAVAMRAGDTETIVDRVLVAIGRRPNLDDLGLETLGLERDEHGLPPFDPETARIADLPLYIAGDANGHATLLHEAADEGHIAGINATAAESTCFRRRTPIGIVFTEPGVAFVGKRHAELPPDPIAIGAVSFENQGRARAAQRNLGLMRIYASRTDARLLGAEMFAPAAEHMAHLLALAIGQGLTVHDLLRMPFYHPVLEEGMRTALRDLAAQCDPRATDLAACGEYRSEALD